MAAAAVAPGESTHASHTPFLRLSVLLGDMTDRNLTLAAQAGATDVVAPYTKTRAEMVAMRDRIAKHGMRLAVCERLWPHDAIVHNLPGRDAQIEDTKRLIRDLGHCGVGVFCYNWMPADDWSRTSIDTPTRGGALVSAFDMAAQDLTLDADVEGYRRGGKKRKPTPAAELWANLRYFLEQVLPVCAEARVALALHPDDPPLPSFRGVEQIMCSAAALVRAATLVPSPWNGICFCQGTLASAGEDIPKAIALCAPHIKFVHFRDVVGTVPAFTEAWHDMGKTDMVAAMRAYRAAGLVDVPIRPDHAPTMAGESNAHPGYEMLGRLFALGYMKGLIESAAHA